MKCKKLTWFGHVISHDTLSKVISKEQLRVDGDEEGRDEELGVVFSHWYVLLRTECGEL